jgi:hypothetical protein
VKPALTNIIDDLRMLEAPQPLTARDWALIAAGFLLLLGILLWRRARARRERLPTPAEVQAAQEDALAELEKLRPLIQVATSRQYAIGASGVVRRYIERRFGIRAPKRSTEEFLLEAQSSQRLDGRHRTNLAGFLAGCDFLKFARALAEVPELEQLHRAAVLVISETQKEAAPTPNV